MSGLIQSILPIQSRGFLYNPSRLGPVSPQETSVKELQQVTQVIGPAERMNSADRELIQQTALASWAPFTALQELRKKYDDDDEKTPANTTFITLA